MLRVNSAYDCITLENYGTVTGWYSLFKYVFLMFVLLVKFIVDVENWIKRNNSFCKYLRRFLISFHWFSSFNLAVEKEVIITVCVEIVLFILCCICAKVSNSLIEGVETVSLIYKFQDFLLIAIIYSAILAKSKVLRFCASLRW